MPATLRCTDCHRTFTDTLVYLAHAEVCPNSEPSNDAASNAKIISDFILNNASTSTSNSVPREMIKSSEIKPEVDNFDIKYDELKDSVMKPESHFLSEDFFDCDEPVDVDPADLEAEERYLNSSPDINIDDEIELVEI